PQARAQRLQQNGHQIGDERDRKQRVAEFRAARERRGPVARIHVADGNQVARPEKGDELLPQRPLRPRGDRAKDLGERGRAAAAPPARQRGGRFGVSRRLNKHAASRQRHGLTTLALLRISCNCKSQACKGPTPRCKPARRSRRLRHWNNSAGAGIEAPPGRFMTSMLPPISRLPHWRGRTLTCTGAALLLSATGCFAAEGANSGPSEVVFLVQLIALLLVGRLLGAAMNRIGQPSVMGILLGGILLGPSVLGALSADLQHALFPDSPEQKAMLDGISQFGILLLLLLTGMETDLRLVRRVGKAALSISI